MANWQQNAISDLEEYTSLKQSVENLPRELHALRERIAASRRGGGGQEERLDWLDRERRLEHNLRVAAEKTGRIELGLRGLDEKERLVLEGFYINRQRGHLDRLCEQLGYEQAQVYRIKAKALKRFTLSMFGALSL